MKTEDSTKYRRAIGRWRCATIVLVILCVVLLIIIGIFVALFHKSLGRTLSMKLGLHSDGTCPGNPNKIQLQEDDKNPSPFRDLTKTEVKGLQDYLYAQASLNLVRASKIATNVSYIYIAELMLPNKEQTIQHLDNGQTKPVREAKVIIFRGDKTVPVIEEYAVGPLPKPTYHKAITGTYMKTPIPFLFRPVTEPEYNAVLDMLTEQFDNVAGDLVEESYGARFKNCGDKCLQFRYISQVNTGTLDKMTRQMWVWTCHFVEFYTLHPLDLSALVNLEGNDVTKYKIEKVYYHGELFNSIEDLVDAYSQGRVEKTKIPFPEVSKDLFSTMNQRGTPFPEKPLRSPIEYEPSGKRYSIHDRHVEYMRWNFDFRMSTSTGPQLFNIMYGGERIVYELSLQDVSVFYSGDNPTQRHADFVDSAFLIGPQAKLLVPGVDCPVHSTFVTTTHVMETSEEPLEYPNSFCIFEHNTARPLRRHSSYSKNRGHFFEGMEDIVLTIRTLVTVVNYDYILDFTFHQNGALAVTATSSGYIVSTFYSAREADYGFRLHENINGNIHHHVFNFKVDIDIKGQPNRFETLNLEPDQVSISEYSDGASVYHQSKLVRDLKRNERDAMYKYNFDAPKYLIFHNEQSKTKYGHPRSYRLAGKGFSKQLFPEGVGPEPSITWARYQVAVTRRKEDEQTSSSIYAIWDAKDPVIQFQKYIDDNESILDEDLVAWVTLGVHHIPHTEDLPVTPTVGLDLTFYLLPYNYFDEDPAMASTNAVRFDPKNKDDPSQGVNINRYGIEKAPTCEPSHSTFDEEVQENPNLVLEYGSDTTI